MGHRSGKVNVQRFHLADMFLNGRVIAQLHADVLGDHVHAETDQRIPAPAAHQHA